MQSENDLTSKAKEILSDPSTIEMIDKASQKLTYTAGGASVVGSLTLNEWLGVGGFLIAAGTAVFNVWFKMKYQRGTPTNEN